MRKMHLKLDDLEVASFAVGGTPSSRGTVYGNSDYSCAFSCRDDTCSGGLLCACVTGERTFCGPC
jgi:hypothetical protein